MTKQAPLISVIVPVYKAEPFLHRCVDSILNQTYTNLEVILVNDGSPDRSGAICDEYAAKDCRVRVIHQENAGPSAARNAGLDICTGEYICFVDSDDHILPGMYEKMLFTALEHQVDVCICQWQYELTDGTYTVDFSKVDPSLFGMMSSLEFAGFLYKGAYENGVVVMPCNKLMKRSFFETLRFDGTYLEDNRLFGLIFSEKYPLFVMDDVFYIYHENVESLTHQRFQERNLRMLDILNERLDVYQNDSFIVRETKRLYCNLYIEYYFNAETEKIQMPGNEQFCKYVLDLIRCGDCTPKFAARMFLFWVSPRIYRRLMITTCA